MSTEQAGHSASRAAEIRKLTVRELYGEGAHDLENPKAIGPRSRYAVRTYSEYPHRRARRELAFGREDLYPDPEPEFQVDVPREFGDLHHRAPTYHRVRISQAVRDGSPIEPRRRSGRLALAMSGVLTLSLVMWTASCNEAVKQRINQALSLQSDYQSMPTRTEEPQSLASNPAIAPFPIPSVPSDLPLQVDPPKPSAALKPVVKSTSVAKPKQLACIDKWVLERMVGQLVILPLDENGIYALASAKSKADPVQAKATTIRVMHELHIGGILLTSGTPAQKAAIIKEFSAPGAFEAPLLIGDVATDDWYGFNKPTLVTSADMGAPALPGDKQLTIAQRFVLELKAGTNAPVFLTDTVNKKSPKTVYDQVFDMRSTAVQAVMHAQIDPTVLTEEVAENFMARGDKGADPCAVKLNR
ncbi:hypothetical protein GCM10027053_16770 [Intrasporangium mesophilum]